MKNTLNVLSVRVFGIIAFIAVFAFSAATCSGQSGGGGKTLNSAEELKKYLDSQPVNGPDKPIKVSITINNPMLKSVVNIIKSSGKYVSLNITGNLLTTIPEYAFYDDDEDEGCEELVGITLPNSVTKIELAAFNACTNLTSIIIPNSVTEIEGWAFTNCTNLTSVTFQGASISFYSKLNSFIGDLKDKYLAGGIGTYTRPNSKSETWTKQK
jgi:hypothetical protein